MALLTKKERKTVPIIDDPEQSQVGLVEIDLEKCTGCKMCVLICPADVLEMFGEGRKKKSRIRPEFNACMACDCCHAACDSDAITVVRPYDFGGMFKQLDRGKPTPPRKF